MRLLVTGAGGFLGRYVTAAAIRAGHDVTAMIRPAGELLDPSWRSHPRLTILRADLRRHLPLADALAGIDAILHVAAAKSGDLYAQLAGTVMATENLLAAMDRAGVRRIVAVSSLGVYHYRGCRLFSTIDESTPLERRPADRDAYTQTKLAQEQLLRAHAEQRGWDAAILRPGLIFGPGNLLPARAGCWLGQHTILRLGGISRLPLVYVENCAEAIVRAAEKADRSIQTFNVIDDPCPSTGQYLRMLQRRLSPRPRVIAMPWVLLQLAAIAGQLANRLLFAGRAKMPGLLVPARLAARVNPFRYDNRRIKAALGWWPRHTLAEGLNRSIAGTRAAIESEQHSAAGDGEWARKAAA